MDYTFPPELFPVNFNSGPPKSTYVNNVGGWGCYDKVLEATTLARHKDIPNQPEHLDFITQHQAKGESWLPVEPVTLPLFQPKKACKWLTVASPDPMDFSEHMQDFYIHHNQDAFSSMSQVPNYTKCYHEEVAPKRPQYFKRVHRLFQSYRYKKCELAHRGSRPTEYFNFFADFMFDIPPDLLGSLLFEELLQQRELSEFSERATGGALGYIPLAGSSTSQQGYLLYPGKPAFHSLNCHRVELEFHPDRPPSLDSSITPLPSQSRVNGAIRQIIAGTHGDESYVGVRSDYVCALWKVSEEGQLSPLEVVQTKETATCLSDSPHIKGELLVTSESGSAYLWTVGEGLQRFRKDDSNLYFNARSAWRWCDFSGHPRVVVYADRTGLELTDIRTSEGCVETLFRISATPDCKIGERVILPKYLRDVHTFHHLVTTQYSAYIMDERFPGVPMVKWDHMMDAPPLFAQVLGGSGGGGGTSKVILGSQKSQQLTLLQYSGGREQACCSRGPPCALLMPRDALNHLPSQLPHRHQNAQDRLALPAAGLACIQQSGRKDDICVLQLTEPGDIFYQMLRPQGALSGDHETTAPTCNTEETAEPTLGKPGLSVATPQQEEETSVDQTEGFMYANSVEDSECQDHQDVSHPGFEVVVNDLPDESQTLLSDSEETEARRQVGNMDEQETSVAPPPLPRPVSPGPARPGISAESHLMWKTWLLCLIRKSHCNQRGPRREVKNKSRFADLTGVDPLGEDRRRGLREELGETMRRGGLLVHGATTFLPPLEVIPVPGAVEPSDWVDELSERLTVSWEGGWQDWWEENLGMNREEKVEALRKKRRRQKRSRTPSMDLSGSFTSSVTYQSDLDQSGGWSSSTLYDGDSDGTVVSSFSIGDSIGDRSRRGTPQGDVLRRQPTSSSPPHKDIPSMPPKTVGQPKKDYFSSTLERQELSQGSYSATQVLSSQVSTLSSSQRAPSSQGKKKKSRIGF